MDFNEAKLEAFRKIKAEVEAAAGQIDPQKEITEDKAKAMEIIKDMIRFRCEKDAKLALMES